MADEWLCCSLALVGDVEESFLWRVSNSMTAVPHGSLCETGGIDTPSQNVMNHSVR